MDLEVVIVSHRDERWLKPCIDSLDGAAGACAFRATVVANGGSPIALPDGSNRRVLHLENLGFAAANNVGARGSAAELLLFLSPGTELAQGNLEMLVETMRERPEVGLLAVRQLTSDGPVETALAVRREAFEAVGGFDERCFRCLDETDLRKRIQDAGWHAHVQPEITLHPPRETATVMGLPFHGLDHETLVRRFVEEVRAGKGGWIVTPNLDILRQFTTSPESRDLILAASHRVADGLPIVWASRLAGTPLPERVPGSDFVLTLPEAAARAGLSVFLLGGNPGVAEAAAARLEAEHPGIRLGFHCPPFGFEDDPAELDRIRAALLRAQPALVLVGLGFPKQERVIRLLRPELPGTWFAGVGISLSFLAGDQPRAPLVLQRLGLEWTHRLWHEPRRLFKRYVVQGLPFAVRLFAWALAQRLRHGR